MSSIVVAGDTSGSVTLSAPAVAGTVVITLPSASGTMTSFASGTVMLFVQTAAPTGWTKSTTHDNKALRVISGTVGTGGSVAFTTAFASQAVSGTNGASGAYTLATADIPSHSHIGGSRRIWDATAGEYGSTGDLGSVANPLARHTAAQYRLDTTSSTGGGGSHSHSAASFTGTAINLAVSYVDVIIATKD